mgnify:CR=1 FL=1
MNAVGVKLGNGWYSQEQYLLSPPNGANYGTDLSLSLRKRRKFGFSGPPRLLFILNVTFTDGRSVQIYSDQTWSGRQGSIIHDSVYNGEIYDARLDRPHWDEANFNDPLSLWISPEILQSPLNLSLLSSLAGTIPAAPKSSVADELKKLL